MQPVARYLPLRSENRPQSGSGVPPLTKPKPRAAHLHPLAIGLLLGLLLSALVITTVLILTTH